MPRRKARIRHKHRWFGVHRRPSPHSSSTRRRCPLGYRDSRSNARVRGSIVRPQRGPLMSTQITEGEVRSADGTSIGYLKAGTGPALVVAHGSLSTGTSEYPLPTASPTGSPAISWTVEAAAVAATSANTRCRSCRRHQGGTRCRWPRVRPVGPLLRRHMRFGNREALLRSQGDPLRTAPADARAVGHNRPHALSHAWRGGPFRSSLDLQRTAPGSEALVGRSGGISIPRSIFSPQRRVARGHGVGKTRFSTGSRSTAGKRMP